MTLRIIIIPHKRKIYLYPFTPYHMSLKKLKELKNQLKDLLAKGFIRPNISPCDDPMLFDRKKDGSIYIYIDYR